MAVGIDFPLDSVRPMRDIWRSHEPISYQTVPDCVPDCVPDHMPIYDPIYDPMSYPIRPDIVPDVTNPPPLLAFAK